MKNKSKLKYLMILYYFLLLPSITFFSLDYFFSKDPSDKLTAEEINILNRIHTLNNANEIENAYSILVKAKLSEKDKNKLYEYFINNAIKTNTIAAWNRCLSFTHNPKQIKEIVSVLKIPKIF